MPYALVCEGYLSLCHLQLRLGCFLLSLRRFEGSAFQLCSTLSAHLSLLRGERRTNEEVVAVHGRIVPLCHTVVVGGSFAAHALGSGVQVLLRRSLVTLGCASIYLRVELLRRVLLPLVLHSTSHCEAVECLDMLVYGGSIVAVQSSLVVEGSVILGYKPLHLHYCAAAVFEARGIVVNGVVEYLNAVDFVGYALRCGTFRLCHRVFLLFQLLQLLRLLFQLLVSSVDALLRLVGLLGERHECGNCTYNGSGKQYIRVLQRGYVKRLLRCGEKSQFLAEHHHELYVGCEVTSLLYDPHAN